MAVSESLYRKLKDAGFSHQAALILSDSEDTTLANGSVASSSRVAALEHPAHAADDWTVPTGAISQTYSRLVGPENGAILATGRMSCAAIAIPDNKTISTATFLSGQTAAGSPTNQWAALYNSAGALLGVTADKTTEAWAADTLKTFTFSTPIEITEGGVFYLGLMVAATTVPTLACSGTIAGGATVNGILPKVAFDLVGAGGMTTPASALADISSHISGSDAAGLAYAYVS